MPEPTNEERAARAEAALRAYQEAHGLHSESEDELAVDLMTDILHYVNQLPKPRQEDPTDPDPQDDTDPERVFRMAWVNFEDEATYVTLDGCPMCHDAAAVAEREERGYEVAAVMEKPIDATAGIVPEKLGGEIAAAPDLLHALHMARNVLESHGLLDDVNTGDNWPIGESINAAIAKAEGRTP